MLKQIRVLKSEHPFWGYRTVWAYLKFVAGLPVNRKRVYRLLKENDLLVKAATRLLAFACEQHAKATPGTSQSVVGHRYDKGDDP